jgi:hypothetical protein
MFILAQSLVVHTRPSTPVSYSSTLSLEVLSRLIDICFSTLVLEMGRNFERKGKVQYVGMGKERQLCTR